MSGQAVSEGSTPSETNPFAPQPTFSEQLQPQSQPLDMEQLVPVKMDGIVKQIPLKEALSGYAAHAKVTQVTQELADARAKLQQFQNFTDQLNTDPTGMLHDLARHYGVVSPVARTAAENPDDEIDPVLAEVTQMKQVIAGLQSQLQTQAQTQQVKNEIETLKNRYGDSFRPEDVVAYATIHKIDNLDHAYKLMDYENKANAQPASPMATAEVLGRIAPGATAVEGPAPKPVETLPTSVRESALRAAAKLGFNLNLEPA